MDISVTTAMIRHVVNITGDRDREGIIGTIGFCAKMIDAMMELADENKTVFVRGTTQKVPISLRKAETPADFITIKDGQIEVNTSQLPRWDFQPGTRMTNDMYKLMLNLGVSNATEAARRALEIVSRAHVMSATRDTVVIEGQQKHMGFIRHGYELATYQFVYFYTKIDGKPRALPLSDEDYRKLQREMRKKQFPRRASGLRRIKTKTAGAAPLLA